MRNFLCLAGPIFLVLAASNGIAQNGALPPNPSPNIPTAHSARSIETSFNFGGNALANPALNASARTAVSTNPNASIQNDQTICGIAHLGRCVRDLGEDEKGMFTSPMRLQEKDAYWIAPMGAATGLAFAYDAEESRAAGVDANRTNTADKVANIGSFWVTGADSIGIYFIGLAKKNPKLAETGRLSAEAIIDSGTVTLAVKLVSNRQRPRQGNGHGDFWPYGTQHWTWDSSFPSDHATASMALARVVAGEYPRWYVVVPAYGFAETVGISRILGNQHFPSDILVGQTIGFLSACYVLNHRSVYWPGAKKTLASRVIGSVSPIADPRTRSLGASIEIPLGR